MLKKKRVYLDFAASAPVSKEAKRAFLSALGEFGNPSSAHKEGRSALSILEASRRTIASLVEAKADDIVFTSGATEANALAMRGYVAGLARAGRKLDDIHILYSPTAHASIVKTAKALAREGVIVEPLSILNNGTVDCEALSRMIRDETVLISMDGVCGETGIIGNTREVRRVINRITGAKKRPLLHVDASHVPLTERLTRTHWGADILVFDAQKIGGVRGVGVLVAHRTISIASLFEGGGQERGLRPGTQAVALALAFATAFETVAKNREAFRASALRARERLLAELKKIPGCVINEGKETVPHIVNCSLLNRDTDYLQALLDEAGYAISTRSACETDAEGSRVIETIFNDKARSLSTLRISWGASTGVSDVMRFAKTLAREVAFLDENRS